VRNRPTADAGQATPRDAVVAALCGGGEEQFDVHVTHDDIASRALGAIAAWLRENRDSIVDSDAVGGLDSEPPRYYGAHAALSYVAGLIDPTHTATLEEK